MTTKKLEPKQLLDRMRNEAAELLKYDLNNLTAAQSVRLDRAAALRLELDDVQSRQLAGLPIDMAKFVVASEALERLVGGNPEAPTAAHAFAGARQELEALLNKRAAAIERRLAMDPQRARAEFEEKLARAIANHKSVQPTQICVGRTDISDPAGSDVSDSSVPHPGPSPVAAGGGLPVLVSPVPPPPPPPPATPAERQANIDALNAQPANPAPGPLPEWRRWVDENGIRTSPWPGGR